MTDANEKRLRDLQNNWLLTPGVRYVREVLGADDDSPILASFPGDEPWPTFRQVETELLPELEEFFADFVRSDS